MPCRPVFSSIWARRACYGHYGRCGIPKLDPGWGPDSSFKSIRIEHNPQPTMNTIRFLKILSSVALLPGIAALIVAVVSSDSLSGFSAWCVAHWWKLFLICAALHYFLRLAAFFLGQRASASRPG